MNCPNCGTDLDHPGQGHMCRSGSASAVRPPRGWRVAFGVVLALVALFVVVSLVQAAITAGLIGESVRLPAAGLSLVVSLGLAVALFVWARLTKRVVEGRGGRGTVVRNWAMYCGSAVLLLSVCLTANTSAVFHLARAAGGVLFLVGLLISRAKLQRWLAEPFVPREVRPAAEPFHRPLLPPVETRPRDWDASAWDPEIQADIERRRRRTDPTP